jgi:drug/metabolite transporter (DMT)-like permease
MKRIEKIFAPGSASRGIAIAVAAAAIYGAHAPAERGVYAEGGNVALVLIVTTWMRALIMLLYCAAARKPLFPTREDFKQAFIGGTFQALSAFCIFSALLYLPGPIVIIILFSYALMLLLFTAWRGEIKLDAVTVGTTVAALGGLSFVIDLWHSQPAGNWIGIGLAFLAALAAMSRMYVYGRQMKTRNPAAVGAENFLVAAPLTTLILLFEPVHWPVSSAGYTWLGVASASLALGTFCMFYGIGLLGAFRYSLFGKLEPVFTSLFSVWFLGEILKPQQYLGIGIVIGSLVLYQIHQQKRMKPI